MKRLALIVAALAAGTPSAHGATTWAAPDTVASGLTDFPGLLVTADVTEDGLPEIIFAVGGTAESLDYLQNTTGFTFGAPAELQPIFSGTTSLSAVDADGDTDKDLIVTSLGGGAAFFENIAPGTVGAETLFGPDAATAIGFTGDVEGDGDADVFTLTLGTLSWLLNDGTGNWPGAGNTPFSGADGPDMFLAADLTQDGADEIIFSSNDGVEFFDNTDGDGNYVRGFLITQAGTRGIAVADFDGVNGNDIASCSIGQDRVTVWLNNGSAGFPTETIIRNINGTNPQEIVAADFDNDSDIDIAWTVPDEGSVQWAENDGSGTFGSPIDIATGLTSPTEIKAEDLDNDGDVDLVVTLNLGSFTGDILAIENLLPGAANVNAWEVYY